MFWNNVKRTLRPDCRKCGLATGLEALHLPVRDGAVVGQGAKRILFITDPRDFNMREYPYAQYMELNRELSMRIPGAVDLFADCWVMPALACSPYGKTKDGTIIPLKGKFPRADCCRPTLEKFVQENKPNVIICIGDQALDIVYGNRGVNNLGPSTLMGFFVPDYDLGAWVTALPDLQNVVDDNARKRENDGILDTAWNNALYAAVMYATVPLPPQEAYAKQVVILTEFADVREQLERVLAEKPEWFDFDYESNCVKAQHPEAQLYSVSWAIEDGRAYSVPFGGWNHFTKEQLDALYALFRAIMRHPDIKKSCHNLPMEDSWTNVHLGTTVTNWGWDSLVGQHLLNVARRTKSLKFQVFARFGYGPYEHEVQQWLHSSEGQRLNNIHKAPMRTVLHYGGLDAVFARKLRQEQMRAMQVGKSRPNKLRDCFLNLYLPGAVTMSAMSQNGIRIDTKYYENLDVKLKAEQEAILAEIKNDPAIQEYERQNRAEFKVSSGDDVRALLFNQLGYIAESFTGSGAESVTAEVLEEIDMPVTQNILKWRKLDKILGTYVAQYLFETDNGFMHPAFNLGIARSGRSSSSSPNMQNVPKRDAYSKKIIRGGMYPHRGFRMGEVDYGSQEVRIFTCHTKDPVLIDYLTHGGDMHRDEACHVFELSPEQVHKAVRNNMKMGWVFALLYGSYYKSCAIKMWEDIVTKQHLVDPNAMEHVGVSMAEHMRSKGVFTQDDFIDWCKTKEAEFWEKFHVTRAYQESTVPLYKKRGYIETLFGFRRAGVLSRNKLVNTPTQGSGFQTLLWSCNEIREQAQREGWKTKLVGQVHDSAVGNFADDELQHVLTSIEYIMTTKIRERFDFLIVPLEIEVELGPVDNPWSSLEPWEKKEGVWQPATA